MSVLITGSEGFLGRNLSKYLDKKNIPFYTMGLKEVKRQNHFQIPSIKDKLSVQEILKSIKPSIIYHFAGSPIGDEEEMEELNFGYANNIIKGLENNSLTDTNLLLIGTSAEYGFVKEEDLPITEEYIPQPESGYGKSKLKQTNHFLGINLNKHKTIVLRPFNIYGPGMPDYLSISNFINQIKELSRDTVEDIKYLNVGNLEVARDFIYVDDFIDILWRLSQESSAYGEVYNVCSGKPLSLKKIVEYMIILSGEKITIKQQRSRMRKADMKIHFGDNKKILSVIGKVNFTDWKKGIEEMFE
jgi:GDP-4-dehydro-6-deoxy-D-mannose reductase